MDHVDGDLGACTWTELADLSEPPVLLVPIGATEQHGPHLPLATDTIVAEALARLVADRIDPAGARVLVTPALTITASGEHQGFPGTLSIGTAAMVAVVIELVRSADWSAGVILVNGHGGNLAAVTEAVDVLTAEGRRVRAWWPRLPDADPHAGHVETSLLLALDPTLVRLDRTVAGPTPSMADLRRDGLAAHSPSGVLGDPTTATARAGSDLVTRLVDDLTATVTDQCRRWSSGARP